MTISNDSSVECMRPPMATTLASLCSRASVAVSTDQASAARTPGTLLAAICSPLPEPPITIPRLPGSSTTRLGRLEAERRVVVLGVVLVRPVVHDVVARLAQVGSQHVLQLVAGMVTAQMNPHDPRFCPMLGP